jgi:hypothetical protein
MRVLVRFVYRVHATVSRNVPARLLSTFGGAAPSVPRPRHTRRRPDAYKCTSCGDIAPFGDEDAITPCHDTLGAVTCADPACVHALTFCGGCRVYLSVCSDCGAVSHSERQTTFSLDGTSSDGVGTHGGEHVCLTCDAPFCFQHFVVTGAPDKDAPERDGRCRPCAAAAAQPLS